MKQSFDAPGFYAALARTVTAREMTWKDVSTATGVSASTLSRMAQGRQPDAASLAALSAWCGLNPASFILAELPAPTIKFSPDALASAIREMVKAEFDRDNERWSMHEQAMREQLGALKRELDGKERHEVRYR